MCKLMIETWSLLQVGQKKNFKLAYTNVRIIEPEIKFDIKVSLLAEERKIAVWVIEVIDYNDEFQNNFWILHSTH